MPLDPSSPKPPQERVIRVFVSSTFRDMKEERDHLVKFVFPQLRKLCEQRGVIWGEVDLRWGVTDEQKAEGKVLPICLEEIQRCRPWFIGLLGERYGWVPDEIPQELVEREPWLKEHLNHSVTELEILHGVLRDPKMAGQAFFYFRDPAYVDALPAEQRPDFLEEPTPEETARFGEVEAAWRADERRVNLMELKVRIRRKARDGEIRFPPRENYPNPKALGEMVLRDLTEVINQQYPEGSQPDPLVRDAADHEAFARSRARVYIGRSEYFDRLNAHAAGDGPPLVVLGESGGGKSALLSNWALRYRAAHPGDLLVMHFIGSTPYSANWAAMLRRILGEFKRRFGLELEIPTAPDALRAAFANALHMAAARVAQPPSAEELPARIILILDALNQLEDRDGAPDLVWLPPVIPANVRLIVSALPGRSLEDLKKRGWPMLTIAPLAPAEREQLITEYLAQYRKSLSPARGGLIAAAPQAANPLFLQALLEELRVFGVHERLDERIGHYLEAQTIPELYERILARYEEDYEREHPGLVRDAMTLLWAARYGLSEAELLDLLGANGQPLPRAVWSPLYLVAEQGLINRAGLITFFHDYLRDAVRNHYLSDAGLQHEAHLGLAGYFQSQPLGPRKIAELPWQMAEGAAWRRLYGLLCDLPFFKALWDANQFEVKAYWARVETHSEFRMLDGYHGVLDSPSRHHEFVWFIAMLFADCGHPQEALLLRQYLVEHYRRTGDRANLQASLGNQALILKARGDLDGAMALHKEQERICRELGNKGGLSASLCNQAVILKARGDLDGAMALHKEQERICRELGDKAGLSASLCNQALILKARGDLDGAMALHKEEGRICRELGDKAGLSLSLSGQALILKARGDLDGAMALHKEEERICRELGDRSGLSASLGNQALIVYDRGDLDGAMALHKGEERICRELGNEAGLQASLGNQALILKARGDLDGAMALHKEQERICREVGNKAGLQASLGNQANILYARGDLDGAMALYKEQERICRELGLKEGLWQSLYNQAHLLFYKRNDPRNALPPLEEAIRILTETRMAPDFLKQAKAMLAQVQRKL